jgi:hypothetical protein
MRLVTVRMKVLQNGRLSGISKGTDCGCAFSWSICNKNGHFIRCIQSSSFQGYDDIHQLRGSVAENQNELKETAVHWRGLCPKKLHTTAAKVTSELEIHLEDPVYTKIVRRELRKSNIHGRAAIVTPLTTENNAKRRKRWCDDHKTWTSDDW